VGKLINSVLSALAAFLITGCGGGSAGGTDESEQGLIRPLVPTCVAGEQPLEDTGVGYDSVVDTGAGLTKLLQEPTIPNRWFVLKKDGIILATDAEEPSNQITWLDLSSYVIGGADGGLLSMVFHPDYPATPQVFIYYTSGVIDALEGKLSRITVDDVSQPGSFIIDDLLSVDHDTKFHHGGGLAFGPDNYLYLSIGDSGVKNDAQDTSKLRGSVIRIDVLGSESPYGIPPDNLFAGNPVCGSAENALSCPEIFAWGFRNPFRMSFDGLGQLWLGDVGASEYEEIDLVRKGENYGWPCREGAEDYAPNICSIDTELTDPIFDYPHSVAGQKSNASITGGYVYSGESIPSLQGAYVYADFGLGSVYALQETSPDNYVSTKLFDLGGITSFAIGEDGELYFGRYWNGIYKVVPTEPSNSESTPQTLAESGCFSTENPGEPESGVIPYTVNAPFWSDTAVKERFFAIPDGTTIDIGLDGDWDFPVGSVLAKHFRLNAKLIETRLFMRHQNGNWAGYTYAWNEDETEAERVIGGQIESIGDQEWLYPSEEQCMQCHTTAAGFTLGPESAQLNGKFYYESVDRSENQIEMLNQMLLFTADAGDPENLDQLPSPYDITAPLDERARAWLHTNCSQCHRSGGPTQAQIDFRYFVPLAGMNICNIEPGLGDLGITNAMLLAPGDPDRSVIWERMRRRDEEAMPPLGSFIADDQGVELLSDWIVSLESCF
jgi:uncharacterized repeat protein (TIGR03806 family)